MPGTYKSGGWFDKYVISKVSGRPVDPEAQYFVLRFDADPHARVAMRAYAKSVETENKQLAEDVLSKVEAADALAGRSSDLAALDADPAVEWFVDPRDGFYLLVDGIRRVELMLETDARTWQVLFCPEHIFPFCVKLDAGTRKIEAAEAKEYCEAIAVDLWHGARRRERKERAK